MVECVVEFLGTDFPEIKNHSLVFDLFTPWVNCYRILPGHGHMNRILPTWKEEEYLKFLATKPEKCPIVMEARHSRADVDQLKRHTDGMEKFCGIGEIDIYQSLVDLEEDRIVQDIVFKDLTRRIPVGNARVMVHVTFWPDLKERFMSDHQRPGSPAVQFLASSLAEAHKPLSPTDAVDKLPMAPLCSYDHYDDITDHVSSITAVHNPNLFEESPDSPLTFRKQQTEVQVRKW